MTTKPLKNVKIVDGKLVRKLSYVSKRRKIAIAREAAAWAKKKPPATRTEG